MGGKVNNILNAFVMISNIFKTRQKLYIGIIKILAKDLYAKTAKKWIPKC